MTMSPPSRQKPSHQVAGDAAGAPVVGTDIGVATAIADVGRQRHDGIAAAHRADGVGDRIALRDGDDQPVMPGAEVADFLRQRCGFSRVEVMVEGETAC